MNVAKRTTVALCPDCDEEIDFSQIKPKVGLKFTCPQCDTQLVVISVDPLKLDWDDSDFYEDEWGSDEVW
jgi:hypothetical protein